MTHSYLAFIDESGDDGFGRFREAGGRGGSSSWLIISAVVFRKSHSLQAINWRDEIATQMPERGRRDLHFANLNHAQRLMAAQVIGTKPLRAVSILACKKSLQQETFTQKNQLYFYMTRYLIERISWLCRDLRPQVPEGDGRVAITFSRRGGMSYEGFQDYLSMLRNAADGGRGTHWPVIDIDAVSAEDHSRNASLQLADAVASSVANAIEPDRYGNIEPRYFRSMSRIHYRHSGRLLNYGVKIVPKLEDCAISEAQQAFLDSL